MKVWWIALFVTVVGVGPGAQAPAERKSRPAAPPRPITLTGCVEKGATPNQYTLADAVNGKFEVSGSDIKKYLGRRVQVAGTPGSTRFRIRGGLWPTPNVAAQAGDIDPARAAIAAQPGGGALGTGEIDLPTFKVKAVRTLDSACG
ncbi:MAG TPA: hypothetical protein VM032_14420 [Vicinamibacterales bacterium]|nr:hypothetical protein [Vicinamibacterales bacterium]